MCKNYAVKSIRLPVCMRHKMLKSSIFYVLMEYDSTHPPYAEPIENYYKVSSETYVTSVPPVSAEPIGNAAIPQDQAWPRVLQDKNQI